MVGRRRREKPFRYKTSRSKIDTAFGFSVPRNSRFFTMAKGVKWFAREGSTVYDVTFALKNGDLNEFSGFLRCLSNADFIVNFKKVRNKKERCIGKRLTGFQRNFVGETVKHLMAEYIFKGEIIWIEAKNQS